MIRHMVLTSLRGFNAKFAKNMVKWFYVQTLAILGRKDFFPNYKHSRKQARLDETHLIGIIYLKLLQR